MKRSNEYPTEQQSKLHKEETDNDPNMANSNEGSSCEIVDTNVSCTNEHPTIMKTSNYKNNEYHANVDLNETLSSEVLETANSDLQNSCLKGSKLRCGCSFTDALDDGFALIDKTLFIEAMIKSRSRGIIITAPRRMGKSFNLCILKEFFSLCDANGEIRNPEARFSGLKILDQPYIDEVREYMGKHPVVHLNLDCKSDLPNLHAVKSNFRSAVCESYREHLYLLKLRNPELYDEVKYSKKAWFLGDNLNESLKLLTECLFEYHKAKCVFIVDGYDTMLTQLAKTVTRARIHEDSKSDSQLSTLLEEASQFILGALDKTIKGNNACVEFAILMGISDIASVEESGPLNDLMRFQFLRNPRFCKFFGLLENEYEEIINRFKKTHNYLKEAKKLYNGYRCIDADGKEISIYNPWSAFKFASTFANEKPPNAWCETGTIAATSNVCKIDLVRQNFFDLIQEKQIRFQPVNKINYNQLITLAKMSELAICDSKADINLYYTHLLNQGYLTIVSWEGENIVAEIPNDEIRMEFISFLKNHTVDHYGIQLTLLADCSNLIWELLILLQKREEDRAVYHNKFIALHNTLKQVYNIDEEKTNLNEFVINCVSYFIGLELTKNKKCHVDAQLYCKEEGVGKPKKGYLDVAYSSEKCVIIIENKLNIAVRDAIDQILKRNYLSSYKKYQHILIGSTLDYEDSRSYKLGYLINSKCADELETLE